MCPCGTILASYPHFGLDLLLFFKRIWFPPRNFVTRSTTGSIYWILTMGSTWSPFSWWKGWFVHKRFALTLQVGFYEGEVLYFTSCHPSSHEKLKPVDGILFLSRLWAASSRGSSALIIQFVVKWDVFSGDCFNLNERLRPTWSYRTALCHKKTRGCTNVEL